MSRLCARGALIGGPSLPLGERASERVSEPASDLGRGIPTIRPGSVWTAAASELSSPCDGPRCPTQLCPGAALPCSVLLSAESGRLTQQTQQTQQPQPESESRLRNGRASKFVPRRVIPLKAQYCTPPRVLGDSWPRFFMRGML